MNTEAVLDALQLPAAALINHRVPKTLLVDHGAPTAADKRHIEAGIDELRWVATLKPTTVGIATFKDDTREALELAVLTLRLKPNAKPTRSGAKVPRLVELVHRAVPYHLMLLTEPAPGSAPDQLHLSLADKRWALNERDKAVLDGDPVSCETHTLDEPVQQSLLKALALPQLPRGDLYALYRGWIKAVQAANAAAITGDFTPAASDQHADARAAGLRACAELEGRIASLKAAAAKEKQLPRRVQLNLELKTLRAELDAARSTL